MPGIVHKYQSMKKKTIKKEKTWFLQHEVRLPLEDFSMNVSSKLTKIHAFVHHDKKTVRVQIWHSK